MLGDSGLENFPLFFHKQTEAILNSGLLSVEGYSPSQPGA